MTSLPRIDPLLDDPVFTRWDVSAIAEISDGQLKGILDRKQIVLSTLHNPGSGRRRMFTGADVLKIVVAVGLSRCGYPLEAVHVVADAVLLHASNKLSGRTQPRLWLMSYPIAEGKSWSVTPVYDDEPEPPLPPFMHAVQADVVVDEVLRRLRTMVDEPPGPNGPLRYMPGWTSAWTLAGLTKEETAEMSELAGQATGAGRNPHRHPRFRELYEKYNTAFVRDILRDAASSSPSSTFAPSLEEQVPPPSEIAFPPPPPEERPRGPAEKSKQARRRGRPPRSPSKGK